MIAGPRDRTLASFLDTVSSNSPVYCVRRRFPRGKLFRTQCILDANGLLVFLKWMLMFNLARPHFACEALKWSLNVDSARECCLNLTLHETDRSESK